MHQSPLAPLLQPVSVRGVTLPNRIIMSPMSRTASRDGIPAAELANFYRKRVEGGVGTVFTEGVRIEHAGAIGDIGLGDDVAPFMWSERALHAWRNIVDCIHQVNGVIFPQLMHVGVMKKPGSGGEYKEDVISSPSGYWGPASRQTGLDENQIKALNVPGRVLSEADIGNIIDAFAASARNAISVGFDGIALHGGHGYLIDNFLWSGTNGRTDSWGGDAIGRTRFAVEVVKAVRSAIGEDMPISFRFSQWKPQDFDGRLADTPQELEQILSPIAEAGVDIFEASTRDYAEPAFAGSNLSLAGWTRKVTGKLTVMVGGVTVYRKKYDDTLTPPETINNLEDVMERHAGGEFDLLAVGRALLNDSDWVRRARNGEDFLPFNPDCLLTVD